MRISHIKNLVKEILENYSETRDNDNWLLVKIWNKKLPNIKFVTTLEMALIQGVLPHFESIRRTRQKLQQEYPHLRGKRYNIRHTKEIAETEKELGYIRTPFGAPGTTP